MGLVLLEQAITQNMIAPYFTKQWYANLSLLSYGMVGRNETLRQKLILDASIGTNTVGIDIPYQLGIKPTSDEYYPDSSDTLIPMDGYSTGTVRASAFRATKSFGANNLVAEMSGADPLGTCLASLQTFQQYKLIDRLIMSIAGVIANNKTMPTSDLGKANDLITDISGSAFSSATKFSMSAYEGLMLQFGDVRQVMSTAALIMHPIVYSALKIANLINTIPLANQAQGINYFGTHPILINERVTALSGTPNVYVTILAAPNCFNFEPLPIAQPFVSHTDDRVGFGAGMKQYILRYGGGIAVNGYSFDGNPVGTNGKMLESGARPLATVGHLGHPASWRRVDERVRIPFAFLITREA